MPTIREQIINAIADLVRGHAFFPEPSIDAYEPADWRLGAQNGDPLPEFCGDACNVADGEVDVTRDAAGTDDYELRLEVAVAYAIYGHDRDIRRARRDQAQIHIAALIMADPTLGLGPQVYAEVAGAARDDNAPIQAAAPVATIIVTIGVDYVAATPAG